MLHLVALAAAGAGLVGTASAACTQIGGNWYCNLVDSITYTNFGKAGSYNRVSYMNPTGAVCNFSPTTYSGPLSPFDEEVSLHFRGPLQLKQFAWYTPTTSSSKRSLEHPHAGAQLLEKREAERLEAKRAAEAEQLLRDEPALRADLERRAAALSCSGTAPSNGTTYTVNGLTYVVECGFDRPGNIGMSYQKTFENCIASCSTTKGCVDVSWVTTNAGACWLKSSVLAPGYNSAIWGARLVSSPSTSSTVGAPVKTSSTATTATTVTTTKTTTTSSTITTSPTTSSAAATNTASSSGSWTRQAYYNAASGTSNGLVFLNNMGGSKSGTWDTSFGSSLSYAASSGTDSATGPQVLANIQIPAADEIIIYSSQSCSDGLCGYYRPGTVAYHGFGGAQKIFLLEFSMPQDTSGNNMPAIWMLNALIPRTQQYGSCSCWGNTNGCGEFDLFEVLASGDEHCVSSIHGNQAGGDSDYFQRPDQGSTIKAAVVMSGETATIKILNSGMTFDQVLSGDTFNALIAASSNYVAGGGVSTVVLG